MNASDIISAALLLALAATLAAGAPWWVVGLLAPPAMLWAPGVGWARRVTADGTVLDQALDAVWIGMGSTWLSVALFRELGILGSQLTMGYVALAGAMWASGQVVGRNRSSGQPLTIGPKVGVLGVFLAVCAVFAWRSADVLRPLHDHWYLEGADQHEQFDALPLSPGAGWGARTPVGWPEAGAEVWIPTDDHAEIVATDDARGTLILAIQGPVDSRITVTDPSGHTVENTVLTKMQEVGAEFPEARYLPTGGIAAVAVPVDLPAGQQLQVDLLIPDGSVDGRLFFMPSTEAIWALHGTGVVRYTHRWQILNQVENQVWANEMRTTRRFTWNQPPGWSPLLTMQVQLTGHDLDAAGLLFLWILAFVGLSGVRAAHALAPGAPTAVWLAPAGLAASHGLLMLEPASHNFPDSLYAAAVVSLLSMWSHGGAVRYGIAGAVTQALRWPGTVVAVIVLAAAALWSRDEIRSRLGALVGFVAIGGAIAIAAIYTGDADDLGFILYFETFPEHWHGEYGAGSLLPRMPHFYALWVAYTGGGIVLALLSAIGPRNPARTALRVVLTVAITYSLFLCTIDHHPTHYFLPLVALTGPAVVCAAAAHRQKWIAQTLVAIFALGLFWFLSGNRVW